MKAPRAGKASHHISRSPEQTRSIGRAIAKSLTIPGVVLLYGDLGAGKTTITQGLVQGLGVTDPGVVNSPSYTLVNVYHGRCEIYHVDLYRLDGRRDLYSIGLDDFLGVDGITIVEWSERLADVIENATSVEIEDAGGEMRNIFINRKGV